MVFSNRLEEVQMTRNALPPPAVLMNYIVGKWISKPIYVAAELGIADMLADGPMSIEELAKDSQSHAPSLYRMMRALSSVGIFLETEGGKFELTPMAEYLKSDAMRSIALMFNSEWNDKAWIYFLDSVKTGGTAFEKANGMPVSDWLQENPQAEEVFSEANAFKAGNSHRAIVDVYDFTNIGTLTDIGGGTGTLVAEVLNANPTMKGILAETPSVIQKARRLIQERRLEDRCQLVDCDFFKEIPAGSDAYLMSHILHDWPDEKCRQILSNCRRAMNNGSKLLIVEMIVPSGNEPHISKLLDLEMMVITGGLERTENEYKELLETSGFKLSRIIPTKEGISIIEGIRIQA